MRLAGPSPLIRVCSPRAAHRRKRDRFIFRRRGRGGSPGRAGARQGFGVQNCLANRVRQRFTYPSPRLCLALAIEPRFRRCKPGGFGAFRIVERAARVGRANRRRLFAEKGDAELADPLAWPFRLRRERDGVQAIAVFLLPAAVAVQDAVAGLGVDGRREQPDITPAEHRPAAPGGRTGLAQLLHGASIAQERQAGFL